LSRTVPMLPVPVVALLRQSSVTVGSRPPRAAQVSEASCQVAAPRSTASQVKPQVSRISQPFAPPPLGPIVRMSAQDQALPSHCTT